MANFIWYNILNSVTESRDFQCNSVNNYGGMSLKNAFEKKLIALVLAVSASLCMINFGAFATGSNTSSNTSSQTSSDPDADVPVVSVSSNEQETLGTVNFSASNTKRIAVGKSTTLYLTIKDMGYSYGTTFETSDESIATVKQIDNRAVKVVGMKSGVVTITATVDSTKGVKVAKYQLAVGDVEISDDTTTSTDDSEIGGIVTDDDNDTDLDLFSSTDDPMLAAYAETRSDNNATSILLGLIGWVLIILAVVYVFSVIIRNRTPKMNVSPGSRRRYSAGGSTRSGNRLLPDRYYRNLKKY